MELVSKPDEEELMRLLTFVAKDPDAWINIYINFGHVSEQLFEKESLSRQLLDRIEQSSLHIARTLTDSKIGGCEGKIFLFDDGDILALFKKDVPNYENVLAKLKKDFTATGLIDILSI